MFIFGIQSVTSNITLYAYWASVTPDQPEFLIDFNLNYLDAPIIESRQTICGRLYNAPIPTRSGYEFKGWWISMYDDSQKLSYCQTRDTEFEEHTTLYALWQAASAAPKLAAPITDVGSNSIRWEAVSSATSYLLEIIGPNGFAGVNETTASTTKAVNFSIYPEGDYEIKVTALASVATNNSETSVRYYKNKALARVSVFSIAEPSMFTFMPVKNATRYRITVECGDDLHNHTNLDLGASTFYDFANCSMQPDGIKFTVTAEAAGYASSVSRPFYFTRILSEVSGFYIDESTQPVSWSAVPYAANYVISILCTDTYHSHQNLDNGNRTSYCIKECNAGVINISVYAKANGYNSPAPGLFVYNKVKLASPRDIRVEGSTIK